MSSFFIRNPNDRRGTKRKGGKPKVHFSTKDKKFKNREVVKDHDKYEDEEIPSDDEEIDFNDKGKESTDEDESLTAQEKKLKLAKQYLQEIEDEEKKRLDHDEIGNDVILERLKEDVLGQAGKLKRSVANELNTNISDEHIKVLRCKDHKLAITCVVISNDSKFVYSGSKDGTIVKWSIDGKRLKVIPPKHKDKGNENLHSSTILALAISFDSKYLASGDESPLVRIWNPETLNHIYTFKGHRAPVTGLSFCKVSNNLYSCSRDKTVKVWSMPEKAYIETLFGHYDPITSIDVLCKGRAVTSGGTDNTCRVWKIEEETQLVYNGNSRSIDCVKRLDDSHFISCDDSGNVALWGTLKKKPLCVVQNAHGVNTNVNEGFWISSVACISNSEVFASGSNDGFVRFWSCSDSYREIEALFKIPVKGFVNSMVFSTDFRYLILGVGQEHRLGRWERIKEAKNCVLVINLVRNSNKLSIENDNSES